MSKNKDPAVLFYTEAYLVGTKLFTYEQKGKYMDLLCLQHQQGHLTEEDMLAICGKRDTRIFDKFLQDENGLYYNERMEEEAEKRKAFTESRRANGSKKYEKTGAYAEPSAEHMQVHMRNRNKNINIIKDVITYLNNKLSTKYLYESEDVIKDIKIRLGEGFTYEDFVTVIDKKYKEWHGTDMEKFLRTDVLFGEKFQQYLNQIDKPHSQSKNQRYGDFDPEDAMQRAIARSLGKKEGGDDPI